MNIGAAFYMAAFEVTNAQYEQFDPATGSFVANSGFARGDDEAVVFVNWNDAIASANGSRRRKSALSASH